LGGGASHICSATPQELTTLDASPKSSRGETPRERLATIITELDRINDRLYDLFKEAFSVITPEIDPLKQIHQMEFGYLCMRLQELIVELRKVAKK
jgi:hypothetical protein